MAGVWVRIGAYGYHTLIIVGGRSFPNNPIQMLNGSNNLFLEGKSLDVAIGEKWEHRSEKGEPFGGI